MSNYDPFQIYTKRSKSTHKGQVLRKKIPNYIGYCFTDEELERAIDGLAARGYHIFKPGVNPERFILKHLEHTYVYSNINLVDLNYAQNSQYTYHFSDIWSNVINDYADILAIDDTRVQQFSFYVGLISYHFGGQNNPATVGTTATFHFYYDDDLIPDLDTTINIYNSNQQRLSFGAFSFNFQKRATINGISLNLGNKSVFQDRPYLNMTESQQPAILTALRNQDYQTFDPDILSWSITFQNQAATLTIDNHFISVVIGLGIKYL